MNLQFVLIICYERYLDVIIETREERGEGCGGATVLGHKIMILHEIHVNLEFNWL